MEIGLDKQRKSVRQQAKHAVEVAPPEWFTVPWPAENWNREPVLAASASICRPSLDGEPVNLPAMVRDVASRERIRPELLMEVVRRESAFDPCAVSSKGAMGLMQLMPATASAMGVKDPFEPGQNLTAGAKYLGSLLERYAGDLRLALGAYNAGPGRIDEYGGVPPFEETQKYVRSILARLDPPLPPANP
jgi:soluble lytic murein transglycosylase-like protein